MNKINEKTKDHEATYTGDAEIIEELWSLATELKRKFGRHKTIADAYSRLTKTQQDKINIQYTPAPLTRKQKEEIKQEGFNI